MVELPQIKTRRKQEQVLDARLCLINQCPYLQVGVNRQSGAREYGCGAGVYRAKLPAEALNREVEANPSPIPGENADLNPFLLRLLMARECLREECGVTTIEYTERVLEVDPEEQKAGLFK